MSYYPIVKLSSSEIGALETLSQKAISNTIPIIESKPIAKEKIEDWWSTFRTLGSYLSRKINDFTFIYDFTSAFNKLGEIQELKDSDNNDLIKHSMDKLDHANLSFIPCIHFDSPEWMINSVLNSSKDEVAIRIRCHDFNDTLDPIIKSRIEEEIIKKAPNKKYTLVIDFYKEPATEHRVTTSINNFSKLPYQNLILAMTNCPEDASRAEANSFSQIIGREDMKAYSKAKKKFTDLQFGDYTVRLKPEIKGEDINYYNTYLKLFYTTEDDYYIGKSALLENDGVATFVDVCNEIINSDVYKGKDFSAGDKAIYDCATGALNITNHPKPIEYGINHHIELTAQQL